MFTPSVYKHNKKTRQDTTSNMYSVMRHSALCSWAYVLEHPCTCSTFTAGPRSSPRNHRFHPIATHSA
jgi:hypothetical protein